MTATQNEPIPVLLLTGFLGSGKTTLLNHWVRQPGFNRTLVIINEFGAVSLDHLLVAHSDETLVTAMESGCICCSMRGDLAKTLKDITWRFSRNGIRHFDRVVIETTGLADPAPILHTLMTDKNLLQRYRLDAIATTIDITHAMITLDRQPEAVKQAAIADCILLTKSDLADQQQLTVVQQRLSALNPAAAQLLVVNGQADPQTVFGEKLFPIGQESAEVMKWLNAGAYAPLPANRYQPADPGAAPSSLFPGVSAAPLAGINRHGDHIEAFCFTFDQPLDPVLFDHWLSLLLTIKGPDILRVKGILNMKNRNGPLIIHGVQHIFHPPVELSGWPSDDRRTRIVFITRDVPRSVIADTFDALIGSAPQSDVR